MDLNLAFIQPDLVWEDPLTNLRRFEEKIKEIGSTDLIILPEMFSTGFTMEPEKNAETMDALSVQWMKSQSAKTGACLCGSLVISENGNYYNRLIWMRPDGTFSHYDKRHLFRYAHEQDHYKAGTKKLIVELKGWKVCPLICYDLRFPVWSRNSWQMKDGQLQAEYDLLIYVANWPERRNYPWKSLLVARAIENQAYVVGVNRVGNDKSSIYHSGDSAILDFKGEALVRSESGKECAERHSLSKLALLEFRQAFPVGMDADGFTLNV